MKILTNMYCLLAILSSALLHGRILPVGANQTYRNIQSAAQQARPGDTILVFPGTYNQSEYIENLKGSQQQAIYIISRDLHGAIFQGNSQAWHLVDAQYVYIDGFVFSGQTANGVNMDDGGTYLTPAKRISINRCIFRDMNATGNNDLLKLSGIDSFEIKNCRFLNGSRSTSGSGIDMVGCHYGIFTNNHFENMGGNAIQAKGGTQHILIEKCWFKNAGERAINMGGSTGLEFFRPIDAKFEAADLEVYSNVFIGSTTAVAFVGCVRSKVINNTIVNPVNWIFRILQETVDTSRFLKCGDNEFSNNIVYFNNSLRTTVNVGGNTAPNTFTISNNLWYNHQNPSFNQISIPVQETNGIRAMDPLFENTSTENFNLQKNSPAIGKGKNTIKPNFDFNNKTYATSRSIGAFEYSVINKNTNVNTELDLNFYPNPSFGLFQLFTHQEQLDLNLVFVNIYGQSVYRHSIRNSDNNVIDFSTFPTGVYTCLIYDKDFKLVAKRKLSFIK